MDKHEVRVWDMMLEVKMLIRLHMPHNRPLDLLHTHHDLKACCYTLRLIYRVLYLVSICTLNGTLYSVINSLGVLTKEMFVGCETVSIKIARKY